MKTLIAAACVVLGTCVIPAQAGTAIDERRSATADSLVVVKNVKGEIRIVGWDRDEVHLTGELGDGSRDLEITESGRELLIQVEIPRNSRGVEETILYLQLPSGASVEAGGVSARIDIRGINGRSVSAKSISGDVSVAATVEQLEIGSVSGDVEFSGNAARAAFNSVSGDIDARGLSSELMVTTVSGEVLIRDAMLADARFESVSGDMEIEAGLAEDASFMIESLSGDVELLFAEGLSARCEVETFSGSIKSDLGEVETARHGPRKRLEFTAGDGAGRIRIESFSGDVRIRTR